MLKTVEMTVVFRRDPPLLPTTNSTEHKLQIYYIIIPLLNSSHDICQGPNNEINI